MPGTRKLRRPTAHRNLMLRGMVTYLLENGQIETTVTRAKEVRCLAEKMITIAKNQTPSKLAAYRQAMAFITKESVLHKLFAEIAPAYAKVNGGYTAVYKMAPRRGDGAEMALIRLVGMPTNDKKATKKATPTKKVEAPALDK